MSKIINGKHLLASWGGGGGGGGEEGGRKKKTRNKKRTAATNITHEQRMERKTKEKDRVRARPCVEFSPSLAPQRVPVSRALCVIVLRSRGSVMSLILRGLKKR